MEVCYKCEEHIPHCRSANQMKYEIFCPQCNVICKFTFFKHCILSLTFNLMSNISTVKKKIFHIFFK